MQKQSRTCFLLCAAMIAGIIGCILLAAWMLMQIDGAQPIRDAQFVREVLLYAAV